MQERPPNIQKQCRYVGLAATDPARSSTALNWATMEGKRKERTPPATILQHGSRKITPLRVSSKSMSLYERPRIMLEVKA